MYMKSLKIKLDSFGRTENCQFSIADSLNPQDLIYFIQKHVLMNIVMAAHQYSRNGAQISGCVYDGSIELSVDGAGRDVEENGQRLLNLLASLPAAKREMVIRYW